MAVRGAVVLLVVLMCAAGAPALADSTETFTREYQLAVGAHAATTGVSLNLCSGGTGHPDGCDLDEDGDADIPTVGGGNVFASTPRRNVVVTALDDEWGADVGIAVCLYRPFSDFVCDGDDDIMSPSGCGEARIDNAPYASDRIAVFLYTVLVTDQGKPCGATQGTITATFA